MGGKSGRIYPGGETPDLDVCSVNVGNEVHEVGQCAACVQVSMYETYELRTGEETIMCDGGHGTEPVCQSRMEAPSVCPSWQALKPNVPDVLGLRSPTYIPTAAPKIQIAVHGVVPCRSGSPPQLEAFGV